MSARALRQEPYAVSALFDAPERVDDALERLVRAGIPRDLIDIVVAPQAAERYYGGRARALGRDATRFAVAGGLIGLLVGAIVSLILIFLPGFLDKGILPIIQLIGPNFATVTGALIGGVIGLFRKRRPERRHHRALESPEAIVMVVIARTEEELRRIARILVEGGGREPRLEG
jgi:hypothetical protein